MYSAREKAMMLVVALAVTGLQGAAQGAEAAAEAKEVINIELPEPFFGGTPCPFWDPNLEPEEFKDRDPYLVPKGTSLISRGKPVTSSARDTFNGKLSQITDGDKDYAKSSVVELPEGSQWIQVGLEQSHEIYAILFWHFHSEKRVYFDVIVQVSDDPEFREAVTVYNNDEDNSSEQGIGIDKLYIENFKGRLIKLEKGVTGRYVRLYSKGNTTDDMNHYTEVEVFGVPVK